MAGCSIRLLAVGVALFVVSCGSDDEAATTTMPAVETSASTTEPTSESTTVASEAPTTAEPAVESSAATTMPEATTTAAAAELPGDVTIADLASTGTYAGTGAFAAEGASDVALTVQVDGVEGLMLGAFAVWVIEGTCADGPVADSESALGYATVDVGEEATSPVVVPLAELVTGSHVVLITDAPGMTNLACGDIAA